MKTSRKRLRRPTFSGLLATRHGALALALSCALVAVGILLYAMSQYRHTISSGAKQDTVLVSTAQIKKGASASAIATQHLYKVMPVLESQVSAGAITDAGSIVGKVAANTILPGEQLTAADFTTAPTALGVSAVLAPTERAVAVTLDSAHAVANVLEPGDQVDVYGSFATVVSLLVPDAIVLKPPTTSSGGSGGTVLLETSMQLTPRIMWMFDNGKVWLELRGNDAVNAAPTITGEHQMLLGNYQSTTPTYARSAAKGTKP